MGSVHCVLALVLTGSVDCARYLYVNTRPWPHNYVIENPMNPPPIACEIDIHVIDVVSFAPFSPRALTRLAYAHWIMTCVHENEVTQLTRSSTTSAVLFVWAVL